MIELYTPGDDVAGADFGELFSRARSLLARGGDARRSEAIRAMFAALRYTHVRDDDYRRALELLAGAYADADRPREALTIAWYLDDRERMAALRDLPPIDRARTLLLASKGGSRELAREAGSLLETAGKPVRAAIAFERAEDWDRARALWSRLAGNLAGGDRLYEAALAQFDLARASKRVGDARAARSAATSAVHFAEEAADRFESEGLRERAFDCYEVILAIGRETGTFEDVVAGYVNVLRILRDDFLRHYALQKYTEAIEVARKEGELAAAATLARELSEYARAGGNAAVANRAALDEAELWRGVAKAASAREDILVCRYSEAGNYRGELPY